MKQILRAAPLTALVLAGITLSAQAETEPDSVGAVTLYGNITANSPMWQWTVNDYPGARLDAKPSTADTSVEGKVTYPLHGQWFIAASGYLPSYVPGIIGAVTANFGNADITTLTSPDGPVVFANTGATATVSVPATAADASGNTISGNLVISTDELRGFTAKKTDSNGTTTAYGMLAYGLGKPFPAVPGGSCWVGRGIEMPANIGKHQTAVDLPVFTQAGANSSSGAAEAVSAAFAAADAAGTVRYAEAPTPKSVYGVNAVPNGCDRPTYELFSRDGEWGNGVFEGNYKSATHVLALKPTSLSFPKAASGAWHATLTVTAYQM